MEISTVQVELFLPIKKFEDICQYIIEGKSFRVLGLPGLGKTRLVCEAFKGRDYDVSYCDCKDQSNKDITNAFEALNEKTKKRQTVVLDNCSKILNTTIHDLISLLSTKNRKAFFEMIEI